MNRDHARQQKDRKPGPSGKTGPRPEADLGRFARGKKREEVREGVHWLAKVVALFDIVSEQAGLEKCIGQEPYLRNPRFALYMLRMQSEAAALPKIQSEERRAKLRNLVMSVLVQLKWKYVDMNLHDDELQILREEYGTTPPEERIEFLHPRHDILPAPQP